MSDMTNDDKPRKPSGSPEGGQWAAKEHADAGLSLDVPERLRPGHRFDDLADEVEDYRPDEIGFDETSMTSLEVYRGLFGHTIAVAHYRPDMAFHLRRSVLPADASDDDVEDYVEDHSEVISDAYRKRYGLEPDDSSDQLGFEKSYTLPSDATLEQVTQAVWNDNARITNEEDPGSFGSDYFGGQVTEELQKIDGEVGKGLNGALAMAAFAEGDDPEDGGEPWTEADVDPESVEELRRDMLNFYIRARPIIDKHHIPPESWGNDYWSSSNGYGTGFLDRKELGEDAEALDKMAYSPGAETTVERGDDGRIYFR